MTVFAGTVFAGTVFAGTVFAGTVFAGTLFAGTWFAGTSPVGAPAFDLLYAVLILAVAAERLVELVVSRRNLAWARRHSGREYGFGHYPFMVVLHVGLLAGCLIEAAHRPFIPALGWSMLAVVLLAQALRWWCITILGPRWSTRVIVVPGMPLVARGPYRWLRHPNYVAVVLEGIALPLVHTGWITAVVFTVLNAGLLRVRISTENAALATALAETPPPSASKAVAP